MFRRYEQKTNEMLTFLDTRIKNNFFKGIQRKVYFPLVLMFRRYGQKTIFSKWSQNNVIVLEMLILLVIWTKNYFFNGIQRKWPFPWILILMGIWVKNDFSKWSQNNVISSKCWYLRIYGLFTKWSQNNDPRNIDVYGQKTIF